jgi:Tol biopolymer transport system component
MRRRITGFILAGLLLAGAGMAQQKKQDVELQAAIRKETVDGDLNGAIKQYAAIVAKYSKTDRAVAAMAIVHMAECHQKLGDSESRKLYEQVLRDYSDQKEAVTLARARMGNSQTGRPTNTLVWKGDGVDSEGSISPDGRYISFVDWNTGNLAVHEISTGQDRVLVDAKNPKTGNWSAYAEESAISRDGKQVAFSWFVDSKKRYELWIANLTGDPNPRRLYDDPNSEWLGAYDWSPDGKWIAVMISMKDRTGNLGLVSASDGALRVLRTRVASGNSRMFFSPDGKYVGYDLQADTGQHDVWVSATDGTGDFPAVVHRSHDFMMGWSPDGKRLLFGSDRSGSMALWSLPFADGKPQGAPEIIKADLGLADPMGMTRSGALYYGIGRGVVGGTIQIASFDFASGKISSPHDVSQNYMENNGNPCWSSDGKHLAYLSMRGTRGSNFSRTLVIRSAETGEIVREWQPKVNGPLNGWAPDGRSLLMQGQDDRGRRGAFRVDAQTGVIALLVENTPQSSVQSPQESPDGKSLYFWKTLSNDMHAIVQRDLASGTEKELLRRPYLRNFFILSPDGKQVAASSVDSATNSRVMLMIPVGGGEAREVMKVASEVELADVRNFNKGQTVVEAFWAPDSRSFFARKRRASGDDELWQIPVDGGAPRKLDSSISRNIFKFTVSPDGSKVAYRQEEPGPRPTPQVWVLENFLPLASVGK